MTLMTDALIRPATIHRTRQLARALCLARGLLQGGQQVLKASRAGPGRGGGARVIATPTKASVHS